MRDTTIFGRPAIPTLRRCRGVLAFAFLALAGQSAFYTAEGQATGRTSNGVSQSDTRRTVLAVRGMYCESCAHTISAMLRRTPGVVSADVSVTRREAVVAFDAKKTSPAAIIRVIQQLGYKAALSDT